MHNNLTRTHAILFAALLALFTVLTYLITDAGVDGGPEHDARVLQTTAGTICGPLTGAISRGFQSCCLRFSLVLTAFCAPLLLIGAAAQFIGPPGGKGLRAARLTLWTAGWLAWFLGGIVSFAHALS